MSIGYPDSINGYLCLNPTNSKIIMFRDVIFLENDFSESVKFKSIMDQIDQESFRLHNGSPKLHPIGVVERILTDLTVSQTSQPTTVSPQHNTDDEAGDPSLPQISLMHNSQLVHTMTTRSQAGV